MERTRRRTNSTPTATRAQRSDLALEVWAAIVVAETQGIKHPDLHRIGLAAWAAYGRAMNEREAVR